MSEIYLPGGLQATRGRGATERDSRTRAKGVGGRPAMSAVLLWTDQSFSVTRSQRPCLSSGFGGRHFS